MQLVADCGLPADIRGERLSLQDYARLSDAFSAAMSEAESIK